MSIGSLPCFLFTKAPSVSTTGDLASAVLVNEGTYPSRRDGTGFDLRAVWLDRQQGTSRLMGRHE